VRKQRRDWNDTLSDEEKEKYVGWGNSCLERDEGFDLSRFTHLVFFLAADFYTDHETFSGMALSDDGRENAEIEKRERTMKEVGNGKKRHSLSSPERRT